ncbi:hypothetical protein Hdeb2414_s0002g00065631 [Helianthus debilis subsp. tardiflorus]
MAIAIWRSSFPSPSFLSQPRSRVCTCYSRSGFHCFLSQTRSRVSTCDTRSGFHSSITDTSMEPKTLSRALQIYKLDAVFGGTKDVPVVKHFSITRLETQESSRKGLKPTRTSEDNEIYKIFTNVMCLHPPKEEDPLRVFNKQIDEDRRIVISRSNINELQKTIDLRNWTWSRVEVKANYEDPGRVTLYAGHSLIPWKGNKLISIAGHSKDASEVINGPLEIRIAATSLDNPPPDLYLGSFHAGDDVGSPKGYLGSAAVQKTTGADVVGSLFCPFCC